MWALYNAQIFRDNVWLHSTEVFWKHVQNGGKLERHKVCSNCPNEEKEQTSQTISMENQRLSIADQNNVH